MNTLIALLVAGTNTEVGKTVLTSALAAYWHRFHPQVSVRVLKLLQSGIGDRELYHRLFFPEASLDEIAPQFFAAPLAPPLAAEREGKSVDLETVWKALLEQCQRQDWVLVEALGGLGSPVTSELTVAAVAAAWHLPVVLVVPVELGAISQAVANVALARQTGVNLLGLVLSCRQPRSPEEIAQWTPSQLLENLTQVPVLGYLPHIEDAENLEALSAAAAKLELEKLLPLGLNAYSY